MKKIDPQPVKDLLGDPSLQDTMVGLSETLLDDVLESGILRDLPILGTAVGIARAAGSIRDILFLRKVRRMLQEFDDVPPSSKIEMIQLLMETTENEAKVGEKLLYVIDRSEDEASAGAIGRLFRAFLEREISYSEFLAFVWAVNSMRFDDFNDFVQSSWYTNDLDQCSHLIPTGLVILSPPEISVSDQTDWKVSSQPYVAKSAALGVETTPMGHKLRKMFA